MLVYGLKTEALQRNLRVQVSYFKSQFQNRMIQLDGGLLAISMFAKVRFWVLSRNMSCVYHHCSCWLVHSQLLIKQFQIGQMVPEFRFSFV